jgi:hypothetical protein
LHRSVDEFVEAVKDLAEDRSIIGILQPQNYANHNGELHQGKSDYASYWSQNQFDHPMGAPDRSARQLVALQTAALNQGTKNPASTLCASTRD